MQHAIKRTALGTMLLTASFAFAQNSPPPPQTQNRQPNQPGQAPPAAREVQTPRAEVVALVNGDPITKPEFQEQLQRNQQNGQPAPGAEGAIQKQVLDSLIESRLVEQYVIESDEIEVEPEQIDSVVSRVKSQLDAQQVEFDAYLASRGYDEKVFRRRIEGSLGWQLYQQQHLQLDKLEAFYNANQNQFQAESFEDAQQQVVQAYASSLWSNIVREQKPKAEIKLVDSSLKAAPQRQPNQSPPGFPPQ
jgi:hypothetical protein